ncbi:MAG: SdpI family protein [Rhodococcus sp. (in: high G+C Gram-positive bacteria)]
MIVLSVILLLVLLAGALALGAVAFLGLRGTLRRNSRVGVRTAASMRSDEAFTVANKVAAPTTAAGAFFLLIGAVATMAPGGLFGVVAAVLTTVAALATAAYGGSMGNRAAEAMPAGDAGGCGHSCISCSFKDACAPS